MNGAKVVYSKENNFTVSTKDFWFLGDRDVDGDFVDVPYKEAHINHPSTIWVRSDALHYYWTYDYMMALGKLYTERYGKFHLTIEKCHDVLSHLPEEIPDRGKWEDPPQCMPDEFKVKNDSIQAYWNYYINAKKHIITKTEKAYDCIQNI